VQISIAVADPSTVPRFWHKMYVARLSEAGVDNKVTPAMVAAFWTLVAAVAEQAGGRGGKSQEARKQSVASWRGSEG
jgi:hypothetical protein